MSTHPTFAPCVPPCGGISLHRPWWRRVLEALIQGLRRHPAPVGGDSGWRERDLRALRGLSARTLRDIGAPEWVHEGHDDRARRMLDQLRL